MGGAVAGQIKSGGGLTFLIVEGAGHMVPMDQPANVRTLVPYNVFGVLIDRDNIMHNFTFQTHDGHHSNMHSYAGTGHTGSFGSR